MNKYTAIRLKRLSTEWLSLYKYLLQSQSKCQTHQDDFLLLHYWTRQNYQAANSAAFRKHVVLYVMNFCLSVEGSSNSDSGRFYSGQQVANVSVLFAARSRFRQKAVYWASVLVFSIAVNPSMCRPLCEVGGGVNDLHCCATHSWGGLKPGNSWSQQSVHHFIYRHQDEQLDSCWDPGDAASPRLWSCLVVLACCCSSELLTDATFKLKAPAENPVLNSVLKTDSSCFTVHLTCSRLPQWRLFGKEGILRLV